MPDFHCACQAWLARLLGLTLTFVCVVFEWVYFRAPDIASANRIVLGMLGVHGVALPDAITSRLGALWPLLQGMGVSSFLGGGGAFVEVWAWVVLGALLAFFCPNTQEIMARHEPALAEKGALLMPSHRHFDWQIDRRHAALAGFLLAIGILALSRPTEFLYFQF